MTTCAEDRKGERTLPCGWSLGTACLPLQHIVPEGEAHQKGDPRYDRRVYGDILGDYVGLF